LLNSAGRCDHIYGSALVSLGTDSGSRA
jgi:hypothetical protein